MTIVGAGVSISLIVYYDEYLIYFDKLKRKSLLEKRRFTPHKNTKHKIKCWLCLRTFRLASHVLVLDCSTTLGVPATSGILTARAALFLITRAELG